MLWVFGLGTLGQKAGNQATPCAYVLGCSQSDLICDPVADRILTAARGWLKVLTGFRGDTFLLANQGKSKPR